MVSIDFYDKLIIVLPIEKLMFHIHLSANIMQVFGFQMASNDVMSDSGDDSDGKSVVEINCG